MAVLVVVLGHTFGSLFPYASSVGVTVFYVLSGYLITSILLAERRRTGRCDLRAFYIRRALRLFPALFVLLSVLPLLMWAVGDDYLGHYLGNAILTCAYLSDFAEAAGHGMTDLGHTWSLAVEEQFYLLWPLLLIAFATGSANRGWRLDRIVWALAAMGIAWRLAATLVLGAERVYFGPDTNFFALCLGCALACTPDLTPLLSRWGALAGLALGALCILPNGGLPSGDERVKNWVVLAAAVCALLLVARASSGAPVLELQTLRAFGLISYGLYLWHLPLLNLGVGNSVPSGAWRLIADVGALVAAVLSYVLIERPALKQKARFVRTPEIQAAAAGQTQA